MHLDFVKDDFVLLGCDGLFDCLTNEEIIDFVNNRMTEMFIGSQDTQKVAEELIQYALATNKSRRNESDNLSVIIVPLTRAILRPEYSNQGTSGH